MEFVSTTISRLTSVILNRVNSLAILSCVLTAQAAQAQIKQLQATVINPNSYGNFTIVFNDSNRDDLLEFAEIQSFSGFTHPDGSLWYEITQVPDINGVSISSPRVGEKLAWYSLVRTLGTIQNYPMPSLAFEYTISNSSTPGESQTNPILPNQVTPDGSFVFNNVASHQWFDPPLASGYTYNMTTPDSLFTSILNFPTGFANPFTVTANGSVLGSFTNGQSVDFVSLLGAGVDSFEISNIFPFTDATDTQAFPLQLAFNTPTASFTQTPTVEATNVPESSNLFGLGLLAGIGIMQWTRRNHT